MSEQPAEALRLALNEMERLRRRCLWMTRFLIACSFAFWCAADAMIMLRGNLGMGIVFGLNAIMAAIFAAGINLGGASHAHTIRILRAIESLRPAATPASPPDRR